jgi:dethiobiotin synthetase
VGSRGRGLFVTGTDTGVGKTWVMARLAAEFRRRGLNAGVWKPVQSGSAYGAADADSHVLKTVSGVDDPEEIICPVSLKAPLAPLVAARLEGRQLSVAELFLRGELLFAKYAVLLVEGAGGLAVPLAEDELMVHLAVKLGFPVLIVARPGLGTINHTLLTVAFAQAHGLQVLGVILNGYEKWPEPVRTLAGLGPGTASADSLSTNPWCIAQLGGIPVLGRIPRAAGRPGADEFGACVDVERIIKNL